MSDECPQIKMVAYVEGEESQEVKMVPNTKDVNELGLNEGEQLPCVVQKILLTPKTETRPQRHSLF